MPVQTPGLKRFEPTAPELGEDRQNPNVIPDFVKPMQVQQKAVNNLGGEVVDYYQGIADNEAETEATKRETDLQIFRYNRLDQLNKELSAPDPDDNPTKAFDRYNLDLDEEYNRLTANPDDSGLIKRKVTDKLFKRKDDFRLQDMMSYKQASDGYQNKIDDAAIQLDQNEMVNNTGFIRRGEADTYAPFESSLESMRQRIIKKNIRLGNIKTDEEGNIKQMNPIARQELGENVSKSVAMSIENALDSGFIEVAQGLKEKYWNQIDPVNQSKLGGKFTKADDDYTAYEYARQGEKALADVSDPIRRDKIRDHGNRIKGDREKEREEAISRMNKRSYNTVMEVVQKQGYTNLTQLENDPIFSRLEGKMDHKQRQAVIDSVVAPKASRDTALNKMNFMLYGGTDASGRSIREYDWNEFNELASGLSKGDRTKAQTMFSKFKTETGDQAWQKTKKSQDYFKEQALALNLLTEDEFNRVSGEEFDKKIAWQNQLDDVIEGLGPNPPVNLVKETVRDFTVSLKKGQVYVPKTKKVAFNAPPVSDIGAKPPPKDPEITLEERKKYMNLFYQRNKRAANRQNGELDAFIKKERNAGR